jgi:hypothetical protein
VYSLGLGNLEGGRLEESVEIWSDSLDARPRRQRAAPYGLFELVRRDGIKWQLKEGLSLAEGEMAEIGRVQAVAKEDVQDLAGDTPVAGGRREGALQAVGRLVKSPQEHLRTGCGEAPEVNVAKVGTRSRDSTLVPATANGRWADRDAGGATANDSLELVWCH